MEKKEKVKRVKVEDVDKVMELLQKKFGDETIRHGITTNLKCEVISTGIPGFDIATGVGGFPRGRIIEIFGPESSGKTTLALTACARAQSMGGKAAYIDVENAMDPSYAEKIGVNIKELYFSQPDSGEQAMTTCEKMLNTNKIDVIVVDSVAALTPQAELDGEIGDKQMGLLAQLLGKALRMMKSDVRKTKTCLIFINQLRDKMGMVMPGQSPDVTPGGRALKFYASQRIDIRRTGAKREGIANVGNMTKIKFVKNKVAPPFKETEVEIIFGKGISAVHSTVDTGLQYKVIGRSSSVFNYGDQKFAGVEKMVKWLLENPLILKEVNEKIMAKAFESVDFIEPTGEVGEEEEEAEEVEETADVEIETAPAKPKTRFE